MSLAAQSVFKLHEKFMSFVETTSTHYHHILLCLGNRSLLGAGEDGREEASVRKNSQHMARPSVTTTYGPPSSQMGFLVTSGGDRKNTEEPTASSMHLQVSPSFLRMGGK